LFNRDHAGGNEKMAQLIPGIKVYGGSVDNVSGCTDKVENGDKLSIGKEINILCLHTPWYVVLYLFICWFTCMFCCYSCYILSCNGNGGNNY
jgi:hypothetical protein